MARHHVGKVVLENGIVNFLPGFQHNGMGDSKQRLLSSVLKLFPMVKALSCQIYACIQN